MTPTLEQIEAMMSDEPLAKPDITGSLVFWNRGPREEAPGRSVVSLFGIVAMPTPLADRFSKDERLQHLVYGAGAANGSLVLTLSESDGPRYPEHLRNARVDQFMTSPIWRV